MSAVTCRRVIIEQDPFLHLDAGKWTIRHHGIWECKWVGCASAVKPPFVTAYRRSFELKRPATIRMHVSADERYELYLNGQRIGRGSEYGSGDVWYYETYDLDLPAGKHVLVGKVWSLGRMAPDAQISLCHGFIVAADGNDLRLLGTGVADWEAKRLDGIAFNDPFQTPAWGQGAFLDIDGAAFPWGFEHGAGDGWAPVIPLDNGMNAFRRSNGAALRERDSHLMRPAVLPPMYEKEIQVGHPRFVGLVSSDETWPLAVRQSAHCDSEAQAWRQLLQGAGQVHIPPQSCYRIIIDLGNYYCAYPRLVTSGGKRSSVRILWAEALYREPVPRPARNDKGNRNEIEGKYFFGVGDTFRPDGGDRHLFETLWWRAGRYLELLVKTGEAPLVIERLSFRETRYPLSMESEIACSDDRIAKLIPLALRSLQLCAHETYLDCPYYEQLMYAGDTRLAALTTYMITRDNRLPRKAIAMFNASRTNAGAIRARYPCARTQLIPSFALWWVGMLHDYALWRDEPSFIRTMLPGVRSMIEWLLTYRNQDGLIQNSDGIRQPYFGWNFIDWVVGWEDGVPPGGWFGVSAPINWHLVWTLQVAAGLEAAFGDRDLAQRARKLGAALAACAFRTFWDEERGLLADDPARRFFSEHTQCLALLSGQVASPYRDRIVTGLTADPHLARTTISYSHYLFETYRMIGAIDELFGRLQLWFQLEPQGLKTTPEQPEPTRSDCHGWGAHPLYHYFATILGIRPASFGFKTVSVRPCLGPLAHARGKLVHPLGVIEMEVRRAGDGLDGFIRLPEGVEGLLEYGSIRRMLSGGVRNPLA